MKSAFLVTLSAFIFSWPINAQTDYFTMKHETCDVKIKLVAKSFEKESRNTMLQTIRRQAKEKEFKLRPGKKSNNSSDEKVLPDQLYLYVKLSREGSLFKKCKATTQLKKSKQYRIKESDETLYEGKSTRQFPRITLKGDERCTRAIQDTFIHIPTCKSP